MSSMKPSLSNVLTVAARRSKPLFSLALVEFGKRTTFDNTESRGLFVFRELYNGVGRLEVG